MAKKEDEGTVKVPSGWGLYFEKGPGTFKGGRIQVASYGSGEKERYNYQVAQEQATRNNEYKRLAEISSANAARDRANLIQAQSRASQASGAAIEAATNSSRLYAEVLAQQDVSRKQLGRKLDVGAGAIAAGFGAQGIQSSGASLDFAQGAELDRIQLALEGRQQKEGIMQQARSAITGAQRAGAGAFSDLLAGSQRGSSIMRDLAPAGPLVRYASKFI